MRIVRDDDSMDGLEAGVGLLSSHRDTSVHRAFRFAEIRCEMSRSSGGER